MSGGGSKTGTTGGSSGGGGGGGRGFGRGRRGDRRGGRRGGPPKPNKDGEQAWVPVTKLGRLVKERLIKKIEEIYLFSLPIKEYQIVDHFLGTKLKDQVMKIMPVQKQTTAGQRTRFKAFVVVGDSDGHIGLGVKTSKEVATAIRGGIIAAKLSVIPVRRGYWGNKIGNPHTVPCKVTGKCGSVRVRLVPAPRGTGLVAAPTPKKFCNLQELKTYLLQVEVQQEQWEISLKQLSLQLLTHINFFHQIFGLKLDYLKLHNKNTLTFCPKRIKIQINKEFVQKSAIFFFN